MPPEGSHAWPGSALERRLARRLAALRAERGWSLDDLADRTHLSRATISRIERSELSPPVAVLVRLADVLGWPLARLVADAEAGAPTVVSQRQQRTRTDTASGTRRRSISPPGSSLRADLTEVRAPSGAVILSDGAKPLAVEHHLWLLDGSLAIDVAGTSIELDAGDCLRWLGTPAVRIYNPGKREARYLLATVRR